MSRRIWQCSVCGATDKWGNEHQWYGSWLDLDGSARPKRPAKPIVVTCSERCRLMAKARGLVPPDAALVR